MPANNLVLFGLPPWPPALASGVLLVGFIAWQYWWERRKRRAFCHSLERIHFQSLGEPLAAASALTPSGAHQAPASSGSGTGHPAAEPFPPFGSYCLTHLRRYGLAVLFVCVALLVRWLLEPALQGRVPYGFFLLAVIATALVADIWETLLAVVLGFILAVWFFVQPPGFGIGGADGWWGALIYFLTGLGIVWFMKSEHTAWLQTLDTDIAYFDRLKELDRERAARQQQADRELLAGIVDNARDAILSVTPQGRIATWNAAAERLFGFSAREAIGQPLALIVPPERRADQQRVLERASRGERREEWETGLNGKGGSSVAVSLALAPLKDQSGQLIGVCVIARDRSPKR